MNKPTTRAAWAERIERVARHLGEHLDDELDFTRLAEIACLSPYHFHRVYAGITGETVQETVRRRRLQRAAYQLVSGADPVATIANRAGYGSAAAFTRAFRVDYAVPPAAYRRRKQLTEPAARRSGREDAVMHSVEIVEAPAMRLAGLPHSGAYMEIGTTFERLGPIAGARGLFGPKTLMVGVYFDDPSSVPASKLRSFAGIIVDDDATIAAPLEELRIIRGPTAMMRHVGPYSELEGAYKWLYCEWLAQSGREPGDEAAYEVYRNDPRSTAPTDLVTDIHIPLKA